MNNISILHIDDEPDFADMAAAFLKREHDGFDVATETNPMDGLDRLRVESIDCIICDYDMPKMNGIEVLKTVRETNPDLPFILFTGKGSEEVASEALSTGATDYLQKQQGTEQYELLANRILNVVQRYRSEQQATNLRRIRSLVREADRQLVQSSSKQVAATAVCEVLTRSDPYRFAWIGEIDHDSGTVEPYASAGEGGGYLDAITVRIDEGPKSRGPGGTAIREGRVAVTQNIREDPTFDPWREKAIEQGFEATASVPIQSTDTLHGELSVYADRPHAFDEEERGLLSELAEDLATAFDRYEAQQFAELQRQQYQDLFDEAPVMYIATELEAGEPIIEFCNQQFAEKLGYDRKEVLGRSAWEFFTDESEQEAKEGGLERALNSELFREYRDLRTRNSNIINTIVQATPRYDEDGTTKGVMSLFVDITEQQEREEELELYKTMVETVPDGVYALDEDLNYIAVNQAMADLTGYSKEEIEGSHMSLMHDESGVQSARESRKDLLAADGSTTKVIEYDHYTASEKSVPCEVRFRALPSDNGFRGTAGIVRDISERKEREQELQWYRTIVEASGDAVYTVDADGHITFVNEAFCDLVQYREEALVGEYVDIVMDEDGIRRGEEIIHHLLTCNEDKKTWEMDLIASDGQHITVENHLALLPYDDEFRGTTGIHRDITDRKQRERELKRQNARLEKFTSIVSHDLRNPLNVAEGNLELALEDCESAHLEKVAQSHDRMRALINGLLKLAREGAVITEVDSVELRDVITECWQSIPNGQGELLVDSDVTITADNDRLQQALENLLRNAIRHGGQNVTVTVGELADGGGFYVEDDGPGISEDECTKIFEHGYSSEPYGNGLGLSIVREIVDAHDWTIDLKDGRSGGARFEIRTRGT